MYAAGRLHSVDAARGIAVLAMFVAHGYDGWLAASYKTSLAYRVTRELAAVAMPSFVLLAGVGLGLRMRSLAATGPARDEAARAAQRSTIARALQLVLTGYALSLAHALIDDGLAWPTLLRSDALHAIGASLAVVALLLPWGARATRVLELRATAVGAALLLLTPWLTSTLQRATQPAAYPLALWVRIDGLTRFAALPLAALCAAGVALASAPGRMSTTRRALGMCFGGAAGAALFAAATTSVLDALGGALSPAHPAVLPNALDGLCRALCALGLGALAALHAPHALRHGLRALGQRSLWVYALHLPLCYGRLATPLRGRLDLAEATLAVCLLALGSGAIALRSVQRSAVLSA